MSDLLPCPFCNGPAERVEIEEPGANFGGTCIACIRCGASGPVHFDRKENLVSSWNDRHGPSATGLRAAIRFVERRRDDYVAEHGSYDPSTGVTEFPGNGDETVGEWEEIIEGLESLASSLPFTPHDTEPGDG